MKIFFPLIVLFSLYHPSVAQKKPASGKKKSPVTSVVKKSLHHDVYDFWEEIQEQAISTDGKFTAFVINPQQGDGYLHIMDAGGKSISKIERGNDIRFTYDSRYAIFKIKPEFHKTKEARRAGKKKEELPKDSLGLLELSTGNLTKWPAIISYKIPEKGSGWLAFLSEETVAKDSTGTEKQKKESSDKGYTLQIHYLTGTAEYRHPSVKEYVFSKDGARLAFTSTATTPAHSPGVLIIEREERSPESIHKGHKKHSYTKLSFDDGGKQLAFIADLDTNSKTQIRYPGLYHWKTGDALASQKADAQSQPAGAGWLINSHYTPVFSKNGKTLYYGINTTPIVPDTTLLPEEIVNLEVWHWQDSRLQTQQKVSVESDKKRHSLVALHLDNSRSVQLSSAEQEALTLIDEGDAPYVLLSDPSPYSHEHWDWNPKTDIYLVDTRNGERTLVEKTVGGRPAASPKGKYLYWFSNPDTSWIAYSVEKRTMIRLTNNTTVRFADEEDDHPDYPRAYGIAGWTTNDAQILIYDRYDIWMIDPSNPSAAVNLTNGRANKQRYRYVKLDPDERNINLESSLLLRSFHETSKQEALYSYRLRDKKLEKKHQGNFRIGANIHKALSADQLIFSKETFTDFPNWYSTNLSFGKIDQVTFANPQQKEYAWGSVELVEWHSTDGKRLQGLLYKPENFDSTRKYPMMTYFYEKNSDNLHAHFAPKPIRSYLNFSYFTSNDYVVFVPDIVYETGYPGQSAYNCIMPGVLNILDKGFIDRERVGISGHSWGGYQTAYIITRTNLFKAAEAGAPVSNMTSAYGGVRWDTGLVRQAQYERTQSRIGGTLWEKPIQFIENSPLFFADKVRTPLLMMHNDQDGAVPWYQGIEYFLALKRLNQPVWMLNYTGEKHGLTQRQNMTDFAIRLYQFFDHYLKDAPIPRWMATGLPYIEKGIKSGLEPAVPSSK